MTGLTGNDVFAGFLDDFDGLGLSGNPVFEAVIFLYLRSFFRTNADQVFRTLSSRFSFRESIFLELLNFSLTFLYGLSRETRQFC